MAFNLRPDDKQQVQIDDLKSYLKVSTNSSAIFTAVSEYIELKETEERQQNRILELEQNYASVLALLKRQVALQNEVTALVS